MKYYIFYDGVYHEVYNLLDFIMKAKYQYIQVDAIEYDFDGYCHQVNTDIITSLVRVNGVEYDNPLAWGNAILREIFEWDSVPDVLVNGEPLEDDVILDIAITNDYTGKIEKMFYPYGREDM